MVKIYRMSINGLPHDPMSRSALISFVSTYRKKKLYSLSNALSELKALKENGTKILVLEETIDRSHSRMCVVV